MRVSDKQLAYLGAMGIQVWQERVQHEEPAAKASTETIEAHSLAELYQIASTCQRCHAGNLRKHVVFGEGPEQAEWLIVGDFLTEQDEKQGLSITDQCAHLLSEMLSAVGCNKTTVYLTNSVKCRSANTTTEQIELASCRAYLIRQIERVNPRVIYVLGEKAAQSLLKSNEPLSALRGKVRAVDDVSKPIVVSHHPRDLLETPLAKKQAWTDLQLANEQATNRYAG
tara:strand:- start:2614 stop:3291 length:678 start_codon:yes stop_codon:yes gene_type:complete